MSDISVRMVWKHEPSAVTINLSMLTGRERNDHKEHAAHKERTIFFRHTNDCAPIFLSSPKIALLLKEKGYLQLVFEFAM